MGGATSSIMWKIRWHEQQYSVSNVFRLWPASSMLSRVHGTRSDAILTDCQLRDPSSFLRRDRYGILPMQRQDLFYEGPSDSLFAWNTRELDHHLLSSSWIVWGLLGRERGTSEPQWCCKWRQTEKPNGGIEIFSTPPQNSQKINTQQQAKITRRTTQKQQYFTTITTKKHPSTCTVSCVDNYYNKLHSNLRQNI